MQSFKDQLINYGLKAGKDFCVNPILNDLRIIDRLETVQKNTFTSGSPEEKSKLYGGGVYSLKVNRDTWDYKKVISGNYCSLIEISR